MKLFWKLSMRRIQSSPSAKKVILNHTTPSSPILLPIPKPDPGTTQTPVACNSFMQYHTSCGPPSLGAASMARGGKLTRGNMYIAPCGGWHSIPGMRLNAAYKESALDFNEKKFA